MAGSPASPLRNNAVDAAGSEEALLRAARSGDASALERLLSDRERALYLLCFSILGRREDAEDAVQETFLRAVRGLAAFKGHTSMRAWLTRIAVNTCLEQKRRRRARIEAVQLEPDIRSPRPSPEVEVVERLNVIEALASLPPRGRAVLMLKEREGWSVAEIALTLRCTERQVYYDLQKAYRALAEWRAAHPEE